MCRTSIERLAPLLHQELERFVLPGEIIQENEARLVLGFWNYNEQRVERDAGIGWVRQQWQHQAEPTVILGFETWVSIQRGSEASLFQNSNIRYISLPITLKVIQAAIDDVLASTREGLDQASTCRNARDFRARLFAWHHRFSGSVMANILAAGNRLSPAWPEKTRRLEYRVLAGCRRDLVREGLDGSRDREGIDVLCDDGAALKPMIGELLQQARVALEDAAQAWECFWETLQQPYTDERATKVAVALDTLRALFEAVDRKLLQTMETAGNLAGEEAMDGR